MLMKRLLIAMALAVTLLVPACKPLEVQNSDAPEKFITLTSGQIFIDATIGNSVGKFFYADTQKIKDYHIVISSFGGSAADCISIVERIKYLQSQGCHITTEVYGWAMSAGAIIFLAGDDRIVSKDSMLMLHAARVMDNYGASIRSIEKEDEFMKPFTPPNAVPSEVNPDWGLHHMLRMYDTIFAGLLKEKTNMSDRDINNWLFFEDANFLTGAEALELGIANIER